ncbi:MAG: adenosylmethionine decarboxylase [Nitrososphaerota archaeon]|nr:adenosylmethionine decarboxylase [Candidatus Calditenuaceae archaeon]MDW8072961.1 adenosylmethionine decarboxylase [Nitrososphaerota archaeon]
MPVSLNSGSGVVGKHVYGNLYGCESRLLSDLRCLKKLVEDAAKVANMTLVELRGWRFGGEKGGVSVIALVVESHLALHTWPKYGYVTLDIFTCGDKSDPMRAFEYICQALKPERVVQHYADRSSIPQRVVNL